MGATVDDLIKKLDELKRDIDDVLRGQILSAQQVQIISGLSDLDHRLGLIQAGEFRSGNGVDPGQGFSGIRIVYPPVTYNGEDWNLVGLNNDALQVGIRASDGKLFAAAGEVVIDSDGIKIQESVSENLAQLLFEYPTDYYGYMRILSFAGHLYIQNLAPDHQIRLSTSLTTNDKRVDIGEDAGQDDRLQLNVGLGVQGARISLDNGMLMDAFGTGGGSNRLRMRGASNNTPENPSQAAQEVNLYVRNNKFIIQSNDGTVKYRYLDLTSTDATWTYTTSAP